MTCWGMRRNVDDFVHNSLNAAPLLERFGVSIAIRGIGQAAAVVFGLVQHMADLAFPAARRICLVDIETLMSSRSILQLFVLCS